MRDFLLFRLAGPLMAFGEIAVGETRSLWDAPSKSGVLGLVAACLGLSRVDQAGHQALHDRLGFAVRVDQPGQPLRDYHTAQAPTEAARSRQRRQTGKRDARGIAPGTRRADLDADDLNTVLSERIYRVDAVAVVALWLKPGHESGLELGALRQAVLRPVYTPYLGRKSCPLGEPPRPLIIAASGLLAAFSGYDGQARIVDPWRMNSWSILRRADPVLWFEWDAGLLAEEAAARIRRQRRDGLRNRPLQQFADRGEGCLPCSALPHGVTGAAS